MSSGYGARAHVDDAVWQHRPMSTERVPPEMADRAWLALHALPRVKGKPPSARQLARRGHFDHAALSRLLRQQRMPTTPTLQGIASALHVSVDWLLSGDGTAPVPTGRVPPRSSAYDGDESGELEPTDPIAFVVDMVQWSRRFTDEDLERLRSDAAYAKQREAVRTVTEVRSILEQLRRERLLRELGHIGEPVGHGGVAPRGTRRGRIATEDD